MGSYTSKNVTLTNQGFNHDHKGELMVRTFEGAEQLNANLEERAIDIVEGHKADK